MLGGDHSGNVCWTTQSRAMLRGVLDAVLPSYQVRERHETTVYASPEASLAAALAQPAAGDPVVAALFWLQRIPGGNLSLRDFFPQLHIRPALSTSTVFIGLGDLLGVTIAFGIWAVPIGDGETRLATETRVYARNAAARRRFRLYWLVVGPFSALIRRRWLSAARRAAEARG
ncbi:MAG: hypothetical protein M3T56_18515 [Chloroflexota bacterium]|nr:hypothetical protein [Chloroflexota bacterium]